MNVKRFRSSVNAVLCSALGMMLGLWIAHHFKLGVPQAEAQVSSLGDVLSTRALELVDAQGRRQMLMATSGEGSPAVWFYDKQGKARLTFGLYGDNNAAIVLNDENGQAVQIFRTVGSQSAPVLVMKSKGQDRIILGLNGSTQDPFFVFYDAQGVKHTVFGRY